MKQMIETKKEKPETYYCLFAVQQMTEEDIAELTDKGLKPEMVGSANKIHTLVHNIEEEEFAIFLCKTFEQQKPESHLHYTVQGTELHDESCQCCRDCQTLITKKLVEAQSGSAHVEVIHADRDDDNSLVFATTKKFNDNPENN